MEEDGQFYNGQVKVARADFKFGRLIVPTPFWLVVAILDGKEIGRRLTFFKFMAMNRHAPEMLLVLQTAIVHAEAEAILRHHADD